MVDMEQFGESMKPENVPVSTDNLNITQNATQIHQLNQKKKQILQQSFGNLKLNTNRNVVKRNNIISKINLKTYVQ